MPESPPLWFIAISFLCWVIAALAHREAMRYWRAARLQFSQPYVDYGPLFAHARDQQGNRVSSVLQYYFYMAKVDISNSPYRYDGGRDAHESWAEVEVFDLNSKPIANWKYPRWEQNKQPGYADHPIDHYPDSENVRTLAANGRPSILCIAFKPIDDDFTYPIRGADQLRPDWKAPDNKIPPGKFLVRIHVRAKGLQLPAERIFLLENCGAGKSLLIEDTSLKIGRPCAACGRPRG